MLIIINNALFLAVRLAGVKGT